MKKILVMMLVLLLCMAVLAGCGSNTGNTDIIGSSDAEEGKTESSVEDASMGAETNMADGEVVTASEEESEIAEETVVFSADEVMAHIDALIAQYTYNDPEHIKALVIAANLDYISEEDLNTILTTYGYTMENLATLYDECIVNNAFSYEKSYQYINGNLESLPAEDKYLNRITIESILLSKNDKEMAKWYDKLLVDRTVGESTSDRSEEFADKIKGCGTDLTSAERVIYSYSFGIYTCGGTYTDYLDNPYTYYINSNL